MQLIVFSIIFKVKIDNFLIFLELFQILFKALWNIFFLILQDFFRPKNAVLPDLLHKNATLPDALEWTDENVTR